MGEENNETQQFSFWAHQNSIYLPKLGKLDGKQALLFRTKLPLALVE